MGRPALEALPAQLQVGVVKSLCCPPAVRMEDRVPIVDILEGARSEGAETKGGRGKARRVAEEPADYGPLDPAQALAKIKALEQQMYQHARDLEFEDAARLRDKIRRLKEASLGA